MKAKRILTFLIAIALSMSMGITCTTTSFAGEPYPVTLAESTDDSHVLTASDYTVLISKLLNHGLDHLKSSTVSRAAYGDEWQILTLTRSGIGINESDKASYVESIRSRLASNGRFSQTDLVRVSLTLTALGFDPTDFYGCNLIEKLYNASALNKSTIMSNNLSWTLIALDSHNHVVPENAIATREMLISRLLAFQNSGGGFGLYDANTSSVDMTGMIVQALSPYYGTNADVKVAIDKALVYLENHMTSNYGFIEGGGENSCTTAQVIVALSALGIDPTDSNVSPFASNSNSIIKNMEQFLCSTGGYYLTPTAGRADLLSTNQTTYAFVSLNRTLSGKTYLYDMSDVTLVLANDIYPNEAIPEPEQPVAPDHPDSPVTPDATVTPDTPGNKEDVPLANTNQNTLANTITKVTVANAATGVKLTWKPVSTTTSYQIYRKVSGGKWAKLATVTKLTYTDKTAKSGKKYNYAVRACKGSYKTPYNTNVAIQYLAKPKVSLKNTSKGVKVTWTKTAGTKEYQVYRKVKGSSKWTKLKALSKSKVSFTDTKAKTGKTYYYMVKAVNGSSKSAYETKKYIKCKR